MQGTASEATLVALLGAKAKTVRMVKKDHPELSECTIISKLVGYASSK
jgi:aromatic-L-amino-acid decarboxylase